MKSNNNRAVAIPDSELLYIKTTIEWLRDNTELIDHNRTQQETIYNSVQNSLDSIERARDNANTKNSVLHIFSVVFSFLRGGKRKPKQTCKNCRFNCEDDHTCMNDCNVGNFYAEKGLNRICYEGELWEGK